MRNLQKLFFVSWTFRTRTALPWGRAIVHQVNGCTFIQQYNILHNIRQGSSWR
jgi:hypothetical protein